VSEGMVVETCKQELRKRKTRCQVVEVV